MWHGEFTVIMKFVAELRTVTGNEPPVSRARKKKDNMNVLQTSIPTKPIKRHESVI